MNVNWSNTKIIDFLDEVRLHPELWNVKCDDYKNKDAKKDGWASIAEKFGVSSDEAYKKFKSLRTYAKNEEKRNKRGNKSVKWFAYDAISFILNEDAAKEVDGVNASKEMEIRNTESRPNFEQIDVRIDSEATGSSFSSAASKKPRITKKSPISSLPRTKAQSILDETVEQNEYAPFGEHIAYKLSRYDGYTRAHAEMKIMQILYDCDMQMLRNQNEELVPVTVLDDSD